MRSAIVLLFWRTFPAWARSVLADADADAKINDKLSTCANVKVGVCYGEVEQEDEGRLSVALDIFEEVHGLPEADHCTSR